MKDVGFYDIEGAWLSSYIIARRRKGMVIGRGHRAGGGFYEMEECSTQAITALVRSQLRRDVDLHLSTEDMYSRVVEYDR